MKTVIVTGASRGIGKSIALTLAGENYAVVVNYLKNKTEADAVVEQITSQGGRAIAIQADVAEHDSMEKLFNEARQNFGVIYAVVSNAGVSTVRPLAESDDALFDQLFDTNVRGTLNTFKCAAKYLQTGGRIITFSTTAIAAARPGLGLYIGAKAAVEAMSKVFANELRGRNITVNSIAPGLIRSEMFFEGKTEEQIKHFEKASPLERLGETDEIASVVSFLLSEKSGWVNGQNLRVNGGVG